MIMTAEQGSGYFKGSRRRRVGLVDSIRFDSIGFGTILCIGFGLILSELE